MPTKTILLSTPGYSLVVESTGASVKVFRLEGICNGTNDTQYFLQLFATASLPADTTVPLRSLQILGGRGFTFWYDVGLDINAANLTVALSTTEATLTVATGAVTMQLEVDVETYGQLPPSALTTSGDTSTGVDSLQVWADGATVANHLYQAIINNTAGADAYMLLFAAVPTTGDTALQTWKVLASSTPILTLNFGTQLGGLVVHSQTAAGVIKRGCFLYGSSTPNTLTPTASTQWNILARYRAA